jgi:hypothetical protein
LGRRKTFGLTQFSKSLSEKAAETIRVFSSRPRGLWSVP